MTLASDPAFPRDDAGFANLHHAVASSFEQGLRRIGEILEQTVGEETTRTAMRALLVDASNFGERREQLRALYEGMGWRTYLDQKISEIDTIELTQIWRFGAEYAAQGIAPWERHGQPVSHDDREQRVKALTARGRTLLEHGAALFGTDHLYIWRGVLAREAIDFGGLVTLDGLQFLSGVSLGAVRNAVSLGELHPDEAGHIPANEAMAWLMRRREFCPSRWHNLGDDQEAFDLARVAEVDTRGTILVPQDVDGTPFTPEHVVRTARSGPGLSITIGAKGSEEQHHDFYEALAALAKMDVARWRRRNAVGNWGIVRARGPWVAVSKSEIDQRLAAKSAEAA
ncbi:hypothetical protein ACLF3G_26750 [Falsiroseomonas sp. HC035]|uniref:hypothetical protein n=1 Tax=Falsiroseomonas sp. HC035 TaxID=3390999 RepID=UPI003D31ED6B